MKKIIILLICNVFFISNICSQVDVLLLNYIQTDDSLIISVVYKNNTSQKLVLNGINGFDYEGEYMPILTQKDNNKYFNRPKGKIGNINDNIKLIMPILKKSLRYQKLSNGEVIDIYDELNNMNEIYIEPPMQSNAKSFYEKYFLDKDVFDVLWNDTTFNRDEFLGYDEVAISKNLVVIEPNSTKEILLDYSYLLKRKAKYYLQINGKINKNWNPILLFAKKYDYKPYTKLLKSNVLTIVSE